MMRSIRTSILAVLLISASGVTAELLAQGRGRPVIVRPQRDLSFGDVFAGVPKSVVRQDPAASGVYRVQGRPGAEITLTFTLPTTLPSTGGQSIPIEFGPDDAGYADDQNQVTAIGFDPGAPFTARLDADGRGYVWLGGTVQPGANQASGYYEADVVLSVAYTGN